MKVFKLLFLIPLGISASLLLACKKDPIIPAKNQTSSASSTWTGVVFKTTDNNSSEPCVMRAAKVTSPPNTSTSTVVTTYFSYNKVDGGPWSGPFTTYDSTALPVVSGDAVMFEGRKTNSESILDNPAPLNQYSVEIRIYINGALILDQTGNNLTFFHTF